MMSRHLATVLMAASALTAPAAAQTTADIERRLTAMEAEIGRLKAELAAAKGAAMPAVSSAEAAPAPALETRVAALEEKAAKPAPDGFRSGAATLKIGGYVKLWSAVSR